MNNIETGKNIEKPIEVIDYVGHNLSALYEREPVYGSRIDLGLATNPYGPSIEAKTLYESVQNAHISEYDSDVHHERTKTVLLEGIGLRDINHTCIILNANGSYGAGDEAVRALTRHLTTQNHVPSILVPNYSFPNVQQYAIRHGIPYIPVSSGKKLSPIGSLERVLTMKSDELSGNIVYVDYPNNPYGVADPDLLRKVIDHASDHGAVPLIDLAFGEVLGDEYRAAIQYTIDHAGIALGSLTKTQGLAGLRAGYLIMGKEVSATLYTAGTRLVFGLPPASKISYQLLYEKDMNGQTLAAKHADRAAEYNSKTNTELYAELEALGLSIGATELRTPIQTIISRYPDLYERLAVVGISSESLKDYKDTLSPGTIGYGGSAVRMLTPRPGQLREVADRIKIAIELSAKDVQNKISSWIVTNSISCGKQS